MLQPEPKMGSQNSFRSDADEDMTDIKLPDKLSIEYVGEVRKYVRDLKQQKTTRTTDARGSISQINGFATTTGSSFIPRNFKI